MSKSSKRPVGRPSIGAKRVNVSLDQKTLDRAKRLGGGNVSAGIRVAVARVSYEKPAR